jgi:hypothetical protein
MPGKSITKEQVKLYMSYRKKHNQCASAAKAGISERTARRIDTGNHSTHKPPRRYRTRKDPFDGAFEQHLIPLLDQDPHLQPITLLEHLDTVMPGTFDHSKLRTLQRRVKQWLAISGPQKDVIFRQQHTPGDMGISDYTWMNKLKITIAGVAFPHKLYHYRLVYSGWTHADVVVGGESFESLASGLQNAFWLSGGVPKTHRTDSLSAAFNNHHEQATLTENYQALCEYYGVIATRNSKGVAHENGAIESPNGHLKRKIDQQLRLRASRDFNSLDEYRDFIQSIVASVNRRCRSRFKEEQLHLKPLPAGRTTDFNQQYVKVSSSSTINVKRVTYTVPSRLIGEQLLVQIYDTELKLYYGHQLTLRLDRLHVKGANRGRSVDYRHVIHALAKKTNAFKNSQLRDSLIPDGDFTLIWQALTAEHVSDEACYYMVNLLMLAHTQDCEAELGRYVWRQLEIGHRPSIEECRQRFTHTNKVVPLIPNQQHALSSYDALLGECHG